MLQNKEVFLVRNFSGVLQRVLQYALYICFCKTKITFKTTHLFYEAQAEELIFEEVSHSVLFVIGNISGQEGGGR